MSSVSHDVIKLTVCVMPSTSIYDWRGRRGSWLVAVVPCGLDCRPIHGVHNWDSTEQQQQQQCIVCYSLDTIAHKSLAAASLQLAQQYCHFNVRDPRGCNCSTSLYLLHGQII